MLQILAQARAEQYTQSAPLQVVIWLAYRVLDINPRNAHAYTVLAYLFCLLGESERGLLILQHFQQTRQGDPLPAQHPVQTLHTLLQKRSPAPENFTVDPLELSLPSLDESLHMLEQTDLTGFQSNMGRALPALNRLMVSLSAPPPEKE